MTQPLPLREQMKALESLQELDLKIDSLKRKKADLPVALKQLEDSYKKTQLAVDTKRNAITEVEKIQRQAQAAMDLNRDRLSRANTKLESVHNSQEFQAANKEIDQLKKSMIGFEEQIKKTTLDIEGANKDLVILGEGFNKVKGEHDAQAAVVNGQVEQLQAEINKLNQEREQFAAQVEKRTLVNYDRVRGARAGIGFVPAVGGRCAGCNMMVPPQLYNEIQKLSQVHQCPSCHRILFVPVDTKK